MAYRNDLEALEARHAALEAEVAERMRERDEAARMLEEARARQHAQIVAADYAAGGPARRRRQMVAIGAGVAGSIALIITIAHFAKRPSRAERRMQQVYTEYERYTNEVCACTTIACSERVMEKITAWSSKLASEYHEDPEPSPQMMERFTALAQRMTDCFSDLHARDDRDRDRDRIEMERHPSQQDVEMKPGTVSRDDVYSRPRPER